MKTWTEFLSFLDHEEYIHETVYVPDVNEMDCCIKDQSIELPTEMVQEISSLKHRLQ